MVDSVAGHMVSCRGAGLVQGHRAGKGQGGEPGRALPHRLKARKRRRMWLPWSGSASSLRGLKLTGPAGSTSSAGRCSASRTGGQPEAWSRSKAAREGFRPRLWVQRVNWIQRPDARHTHRVHPVPNTHKTPCSPAARDPCSNGGVQQWDEGWRHPREQLGGAELGLQVRHGPGPWQLLQPNRQVEPRSVGTPKSLCGGSLGVPRHGSKGHGRGRDRKGPAWLRLNWHCPGQALEGPRTLGIAGWPRGPPASEQQGDQVPGNSSPEQLLEQCPPTGLCPQSPQRGDALPPCLSGAQTCSFSPLPTSAQGIPKPPGSPQLPCEGPRIVEGITDRWGWGSLRAGGPIAVLLSWGRSQLGEGQLRRKVEVSMAWRSSISALYCWR